MDVVYILGTGSLVNNLELKYSIRSLEKYMRDLRRVYVVGEECPHLPNVEHVFMQDPTKEGWKNAYLKIKRACELQELSSEFLLMNDDFFLTKPMTGADWPFYALRGSNGGTCGMHSFQIHAPVRISKEYYKTMPFSVDLRACRSPRTFFLNFYKAPPMFCDDFVLRIGEKMPVPDEQIKKWPCFSIDDTAMLVPEFVLWLDEMYPEPSRFEQPKGTPNII
jgi:hypothetical protein